MVLTEDKGPIDPHSAHSERLMEHAAEQFELGDRLQASEKAWGATARRLKTFTNRRGWTCGNNRDANRVIHRIAQEGFGLRRTLRTPPDPSPFRQPRGM